MAMKNNNARPGESGANVPAFPRQKTDSELTAAWHFLGSPFARSMACLRVLDVHDCGGFFAVLSEHDRAMRWHVTMLHRDYSFKKSSHSNCQLTLVAWWVGFTGRRPAAIVGQEPAPAYGDDEPPRHGFRHGREYPEL